MKTMYNQYKITSSYKGNKSWSCNNDNYNNHMIYITNTETHERLAFEYWSSIIEGEIQTEESLIQALYCFICDVMEGLDIMEGYSLEDFNNDYDYEYKEGKKIYNQLKKSLEKYNRVFTEEIYDVLSDLQDNYNC